MVNKLKEYWFGILICFIVIACLIFSLLVVLSPHTDAKMRGFSPCTYELAIRLSQQSGEKKLWGVVGAVTDANLCYVSVIRKGVELWVKGEQSTPWANYMYEPEAFYDDENVEPLSEDLLKANLLNEDDSMVVKFIDEDVSNIVDATASENTNVETVSEGSDEQM